MYTREETLFWALLFMIVLCAFFGFFGWLIEAVQRRAVPAVFRRRRRCLSATRVESMRWGVGGRICVAVMRRWYPRFGSISALRMGARIAGFHLPDTAHQYALREKLKGWWRASDPSLLRGAFEVLQWGEIEREAHYLWHGGVLPPYRGTLLTCYALAIWGAVKQVARIVQCAAVGHRLRDESSIGSESGTECIECARCGWSWSHTYY